LEARSRLGGRVWTDRSTGSPLELGASWIHGTQGNPLTSLARRASLVPVPTRWDEILLVDRGGNGFSDAEWRRLDGAVEVVFRHLAAAANRATLQQPLADALPSAIQAAGLEGKLLDALHWLVGQEIEGEYAASAGELSLASWRAEKSYPGPDAMLRGGYDQIINLLAAGLDIRQHCLARSIESSANGVSVVCDNSVEYADHVIVTVPLGVLKAGTLQFFPALPPEKLAAISRLRMGLLDKVGLVFEQPLWPDWVHVAGCTRGNDFGFYPLGQIANRPAISGLVAGPAARSLEQMPDEAVLDLAMSELRILFGRNLPNPTAFVRTRWAQDPLALGSYSFVPAGASLRDCQILSQPIGSRIFFAGEATEPSRPSTVHGAYLSGLREARRIQRLNPARS
jgi:polyamine oxidase